MPLVSRLTPSPSGLAMISMVALAGALVLGGCDDGGSEPAPAPTPSSTPLADFDPSGVSVGRADFCALVAPTAVEEALAGPVSDARTWANGDRTEVAPGVRDVVHEYGCSWSAEDAEARAWVFAPPVTAAQARVLARSAADAKGCTTIPDAVAYGSPTAAVRCRADDATTTTLHGLFGDAWLSCSLTAPSPTGQGQPAELLQRAGQWCVTVAQASSS